MRKKLIQFLLCVCCLLQTAYAQTYSNIKKGDIIDVNGTKGIVFSVNEEGTHGSIMSVKVLRGMKNALCSKKQYANEIITEDKENGKLNTRKVFEYCAQNNIDLKEFPAFAWCKKLGEGWYIPSISQLEKFINYWLGNDNEIDWNEEEDTESEINESLPHTKVINKKLIEAGGIPFLNGVYTSTKNEKGDIYTYWYNERKGWWKFYKRNPMNLDSYTVGRAFYDF